MTEDIHSSDFDDLDEDEEAEVVSPLMLNSSQKVSTQSKRPEPDHQVLVL